MVFITYGEIVENKARVLAAVYTTAELSEEMKSTGVFVEEIPAPDLLGGIPTLMVNPDTKELWYEYSLFPEPPLYPATAVGQLQKQVDDLKLLLAELIEGGAA